MPIHIKVEATKGEAFLEEGGESLAEMTFSIASPNFIIINSTDVDKRLRGTGVGRKLFMAIVAKARRERLKVIPICPYFRSVFAKDQSVRDVLLGH